MTESQVVEILASGPRLRAEALARTKDTNAAYFEVHCAIALAMEVIENHPTYRARVALDLAVAAF